MIKTACIHEMQPMCSRRWMSSEIHWMVYHLWIPFPWNQLPLCRQSMCIRRTIQNQSIKTPPRHPCDADCPQAGLPGCVFPYSICHKLHAVTDIYCVAPTATSFMLSLTSIVSRRLPQASRCLSDMHSEALHFSYGHETSHPREVFRMQQCCFPFALWRR